MMRKTEETSCNFNIYILKNTLYYDTFLEYMYIIIQYTHIHNTIITY